jgi:hypothetical protein
MEDKLVFVIHTSGNFEVPALTGKSVEVFRAGALSDKDAASYLHEHFVAAHQQVGNVRIVGNTGGLQKTAGAVVSYFCTADGRVIHAVAGPVSGAKLLAEAQWAVKSHDQATAEAPPDGAILAAAHRAALLDLPPESRDRLPAGRIHRLLADRPLPLLSGVYRTLFEDIARQTPGGDPASLADIQRAFREAKSQQLPMLFILHKEKSDAVVLKEWDSRVVRVDDPKSDLLNKLAAAYVVIAVPMRELATLSAELQIRPLAAPDYKFPVFAVVRSDGRQISAVTSWARKDDLIFRLAQGLVQEAKERPRTREQLESLWELVTKIDADLASQVARLIKEAR